MSSPTKQFSYRFCIFLLLLLFTPFLFAQQGLQVAFYDGIDFNQLASIKTARNIDLYWNNVPPINGIDPHRCSIRWLGKIKPPKTGTYQFSARVDDGIRVRINGQWIIDQWGLHDEGIFQGTMDLVAGQEYNLEVEYFNALVEGEVRLLWKIPKIKKAWYERWFGINSAFQVIEPEYFRQPDMEQLRSWVVFQKPVQEVLLSREIQPVTPKKKKPAPKKEVSEPTRKPAVKVKVIEPTKPVVTMKEAEDYLPKNIQFEQSKTKILDTSYPELNTFAQFMLDHPQLTVIVEGHTDVIGDAKSNLKLSQQRAYKIANYLVNKGIDQERIEAKGFGDTRPLFVPKDGSDYPANRRVVFILEGL